MAEFGEGSPIQPAQSISPDKPETPPSQPEAPSPEQIRTETIYEAFLDRRKKWYDKWWGKYHPEPIPEPSEKRKKTLRNKAKRLSRAIENPQEFQAGLADKALSISTLRRWQYDFEFAQRAWQEKNSGSAETAPSIPEQAPGAETPAESPAETSPLAPEQGASPEGPEQTFEQKISDIPLTHSTLIRLRSLAGEQRNQNPRQLRVFLEQGDILCLKGEVPEEEWKLLAPEINSKAEELEQIQPPEANLQTLVDKIEVSQRALLEQIVEEMKAGRASAADLLAAATAITQQVAETYKRTPPEIEQARWVDNEYSLEFYQRFTPTLEPRFYTELEDSKDRKLWDARWQLARAAYFKRVTSAFPEKQFENQDLQLLSTEQMEMLYNMRGVRQALEWYTRAIASNEEVTLPDGKKKKIWDCKKETDFEQFRQAMRIKALGIKAEELDKDESLWAKEADAVAWNWIWCSNLIESVDSRYSSSRERHGDLPGVMVSDDTRSTFHPQEKYEDKCRSGSGLEWGAFGKWGVTQMARIKKENGFSSISDKIKMGAAKSTGEFWAGKRTKGAKKEDVKDEAGNKIGEKVVEKGEIVASIPECYPTTTMKSFWEETKIGEKSLLDYLRNKETIPWREVGSDPWIGYLPIKFNKAVGLFEYFNPGKPIEQNKETEWTNKLIDIIRRLGLEISLDENKLHNLKVWAFYAAYGGVGKPHISYPTCPLSTYFRTAIEGKLRSYQIGFLKRGKAGSFSGEGLLIR